MMYKKSLQVSEAFYTSFVIPHPAFESFPRPSIILLLVLVASFVVACMVCAAWLHHRKSAGGPLQLEGRVAFVLNPLEPEGAVLLDGELWRARTLNGDRIARGRVRVVGARGHWLEVEPFA